MGACVFCRIVSGEIPAQKVYEDGDMLIFKDIAPAAPVHLLLIPKKHYAGFAEMDAGDAEVFGRCLKKLPALQKELGLTDGYRIIINQGEAAGQTVFHLHAHLLGGKFNPALVAK